MNTIWQRWLEFLAIRENAEPLAICRITCGLGLIASVLFVLPSGVINVLWTETGYRGGWNVGLVWTMAIVALVSGSFLVLGLFSRIAAIVSLLVFNTLTHLNFHDGSAYDSLLTNQLFLLIWSSSGATFSLDCRRKNGFWASEARIPAWPRYIMIFQLVLCYWSTGIQKISGHWLPGGDLSAVFYVLQDPFWQRWDLTPGLVHFFPLTQVATAFSWWFEVLSPLLLVAFYFRATKSRSGRIRYFFNRIDFRLWFAILGILFHLGIHLFMRVGPFSWIILSYYPALWSGVTRNSLRESGMNSALQFTQ